MDRPNLPAGERNVGHFLRHADPALEAAPLGHGEVTGHAVDFGIVETVGRELVVGAEPLEYGRTLEDQVRFLRGAPR